MLGTENSAIVNEFEWSSSPQAGLIEANGELKVFIDQNLSPGKGKRKFFKIIAEF